MHFKEAELIQHSHQHCKDPFSLVFTNISSFPLRNSTWRNLWQSNNQKHTHKKIIKDIYCNTAPNFEMLKKTNSRQSVII